MRTARPSSNRHTGRLGESLHCAGSLPSGSTSSSRWASFNFSAVVPRRRRRGFFFSAFFLRFRCRFSSCLHGIGLIEFLGRFVLLLFLDTRFQFFNEFVGAFELNVVLLIDLRHRINQIEQLLAVESPFAQVFLDLMHVHISISVITDLRISGTASFTD
jgi:hypothetical protein